MKNQKSFSQSLTLVAIVTVVILLIPFVAMLVTDEVNWSVLDFVIVGVLIFGTGLAYVLFTRFASNTIYKVAVASALGGMLFMIWANLAVGLIGGGANTGNLLYIGVIAVALIGTIVSKLTAKGMERAMYGVAVSFIIIAVIALLANMDQYQGSSVKEIIGVNAFFASIFAISGLLFRFAANSKSTLLQRSEG